MLHEEALWWQQVMNGIPPSRLYPMLNVGSSTEHFRTVSQPYIDACLFQPARKAGHRVVHLDTKDDVGVDVVGDLTDPTFRDRLRAMRFNSVICSHLLEHVNIEARAPICAAICQVLPPGGHAFLSCPRRYPYHPDPIDTGFRPTPEELASLLPGMALLMGEEVFGGTYLQQLRHEPYAGTKEVVKLLLPFYKPRAWRVNAGYFGYLFRRFSSTCVVLRKV
jgi:hypothetical protein